VSVWQIALLATALIRAFRVFWRVRKLLLTKHAVCGRASGEGRGEADAALGRAPWTSARGSWRSC
jgi:hypothetical protein